MPRPRQASRRETLDILRTEIRPILVQQIQVFGSGESTSDEEWENLITAMDLLSTRAQALIRRVPNLRKKT